MNIEYDPIKYHKFSVDEIAPNEMAFLREVQKKLKGFKIVYIASKWRIDGVESLDFLCDYAPEYVNIELDNKCLDFLRTYIERKERELAIELKVNEIKSRSVSSISIDGIKGKPKEYQKLAVEFFDANNGNAILADGMGSGKSLSSLLYVVHEGFGKTLVICPSSAKFVWASQVKQWTKLKPTVVEGRDLKKGGEAQFIKKISQYDVVILNYDILKKYYDVLRSMKFDCAICDEFHYVKNPDSARTKYTKYILKTIKSKILLSGTPILNRPVELFNGLQIIDPDNWPNYKEFCVRYCNGHYGYWGWEAKGAANLDELKRKINRYFLRREKSEILSELPPKVRIAVPVELESTVRKIYHETERKFVNNLDEKNFLNNSKLTSLHELNKIISPSKIECAEELINTILDCGEKVVVFSVYNAPLENLHDKYKDISVILTSKTDSTGMARKNLEERFQTDPNVKIFFGGMKSAGVALTLTAATNVIFIDYSWTPFDHEQAQDRIHRIGQEASSVNIFQIYAKETIDEDMKEILEEKKNIFDKLFSENGPSMSNINVIQELIAKLQLRHGE